ncbi:MAG: PIN domain-containing protein [Rhizonema sp. NSF051]|nr:PIN domain-containing protein [Rhizonema sp. NSF051]
MKRVLFDTDVILDVLLQRQPYFNTSAFALDTVGQGKIEGFVAGHAVTNLFYLLRRQLGSQKSREILIALMTKIEVENLTIKSLYKP